MVKLNIVNNGIVYVPYNENLPTIEVTEEELNKLQNGLLIYKNGKIIDNSERIKAQQEIAELKTWFDTYYTQHEQKFRRLIALGKKTDEGADANIELTKLYVEAEEKRKKIQELEKMCKNC